MANRPMPKRSNAESGASEDFDSKRIVGGTSWISAIQSGDDEALKNEIRNEINNIIASSELSKYNVLFLYDEIDSISDFHADRLYAAATAMPEKKDILLVLNSSGGRVEPAYLVSKTLKRLSAEKFIVTVPRRAKSAATLICLGADEIHMGFMSQLGPIDPQVGGLPVLALGNALDVIADLACKYEGAAEIFKDYLRVQAPIRTLGYYQRVSESAVQYAERLLVEKNLPEGKTAEAISRHLVNHYKDHGFVIDIDEASGLLGDEIIKSNTEEYKTCDEIYKFLDFVGLLLSVQGREFWYVGNINDGIAVRNKSKN